MLAVVIADCPVRRPEQNAGKRLDGRGSGATLSGNRILPIHARNPKPAIGTGENRHFAQQNERDRGRSLPLPIPTFWSRSSKDRPPPIPHASGDGLSVGSLGFSVTAKRNRCRGGPVDSNKKGQRLASP
jgi:hypothetical protein